MIWTWSIERWRETSCGPTPDVLAGTHDVLVGDYKTGEILENKVSRSRFNWLDIVLTFN